MHAQVMPMNSDALFFEPCLKMVVSPICRQVVRDLATHASHPAARKT